MKDERILLADNDLVALESIERCVALLGGRDGHQVVGKAASIGEVEELLANGLKPTVALVDNRFPDTDGGKRAAAIIRKLSPGTKIVSFSKDTGLTWGDENWEKRISPRGLILLLTNLEH